MMQRTANDRLGQWRSKHLVLVGEMATGKTTVGRLLADLVGRSHLDSDELLEQRIGVSGASFAASNGVEALHEMELQVFTDAISEVDEAVISPAASVLDSEDGREALLGNVVVWLDAQVEISQKRIEEGDHRRSIDISEVEGLRSRRLPHYRDIAVLHIETGKAGPEELATAIAESLPGFSDGRKGDSESRAIR